MSASTQAGKLFDFHCKLRLEAERLQQLIEEAVLSVQLDELLEETIALEARDGAADSAMARVSLVK